jgi:hypothetical protein
LQAKFTGTFNKVQNLQFWKSSGTEGTGEDIIWDPTTPNSYASPATTAISGGAAVPTSDPGSANVSIADAAPSASELTASGYSDYVRMQLQTTTAAEAGDTNTFTFTLYIVGLHIVRYVEEFAKLRETLKNLFSVFKTIRSQAYL